MGGRVRTTGGSREERMAEILQTLEQGIAGILTSEGYARYLQAASRFHAYSFGNVILVMCQRPDATHVAGFRRWLELGRCVRKGEKAIRIFAPVRYRRRHAEETDDNQDEPQLVGFKLAAVFDVSQTEPLPGIDPTSW